MTRAHKWMGGPIDIHKWGKDHWSTLLYVESRVVDNRGMLNSQHMRSDGYTYPTKLAGDVELIGHNDWNCLEDIEAAGLVKNNGTSANPLMELTEDGWWAASKIRRLKAEGKPPKDWPAFLGL